MPDEGGMSCVKCLLVFFNFLFSIAGLIIMIVGVVCATQTNYYGAEHMWAVIMVVITVGVITFVLSFFGCYGAYKENNCMLMTFATVLLVILGISVCLGIFGLVKARNADLSDEITKNLNSLIETYNNNTVPENKKIMDLIQNDLECCGSTGPDQWPAANMSYPSSCCTFNEIVGTNQTAPCTPSVSSFHHNGCAVPLANYIRRKVTVVSGVILGIACVEILGAIFACCLVRHRSQYETV